VPELPCAYLALFVSVAVSRLVFVLFGQSFVPSSCLFRGEHAQIAANSNWLVEREFHSIPATVFPRSKDFEVVSRPRI
jgi:hypothetical protein